MKRLIALAFLASTATLLLAEDAASEYAKRAKKLADEEGLSHVSLATHCENAKMWKEAVEHWSAVMDFFPDNKDGAEHLAKAEQRADLVVSRASAADAATYANGLAGMKKTMSKKWRDLAAWAKSKGLEGEEAEAISRAEDFEAVKKNSTGPMQAAVDLLNRERKKCKIGPAELGKDLSDGAQKHADYLIKNDAHPSTRGLGSHNEDPSLPGYTEEGARAGRQSDIGMSPPPQAMKGMLGTFYHRIPLLHPDLKKVGIGYAKLASGGGWGRGRCVIDYSGKGEKDEKVPRVIGYPADKATNVQLNFDNESPDPIPQGEDEEAGMPVTLAWVDGETITDADVELRSADGVRVDGYLSSPEKPARSDFPNEAICFIPKNPLSGATKYHVKVTAKVNGEAFVKEWDFTTGR
ncbi:MAG: hypothetical protein FD180_1036 [Planctomycetota bacterium]|nr:MAG: hypothetical protein FD180_1036 [Planctomycetota bacterium]